MNFDIFYQEFGSRTKVYLENYIPVTIISKQTREESFIFTFMIDSIEVKHKNKFLIEEIENDGNRIIHYVKLDLINGLLKLDRKLPEKLRKVYQNLLDNQLE